MSARAGDDHAVPETARSTFAERPGLSGLARLPLRYDSVPAGTLPGWGGK